MAAGLVAGFTTGVVWAAVEQQPVTNTTGETNVTTSEPTAPVELSAPQPVESVELVPPQPETPSEPTQPAPEPVSEPDPVPTPDNPQPVLQSPTFEKLPPLDDITPVPLNDSHEDDLTKGPLTTA